MGDLFWAPNYIIFHLYFSFLSGSGEKMWKLVLCILCAEGVAFAPPLDWWLINTQRLSGSIKNESHKAFDDTLQMERVFKKMLVAVQAECQLFMWIYRICWCMLYLNQHRRPNVIITYLNKAKLVSPTQTERQNDWLPPGLWASMQAEKSGIPENNLWPNSCPDMINGRKAADHNQAPDLLHTCVKTKIFCFILPSWNRLLWLW